MKRNLITAAVLVAFGLIAGCGGSSTGSNPTTTSVSGKVADGYLVNASVFMDKNGNYQLDTGEPSATTDANGAYTLNVDPADVGRYAIVALATKGVTIDKDTGLPVENSYVLCLHAVSVTPSTNGAVSGTVSNFISPMSTLIMEKMIANPGMTMTDAMTQLRNQMNLPAGMNMMADYVAGGQSGVNAAQYQFMHATARQMAGLMAGQSALVMPGGSVNVNRYRGMMATINTNMSGIAANAANHQGMGSTFMTAMMNTMQSQLGSMPMTGGFMNYSGMFRNMTSSRHFWNTTSGTATPMTPMRGGMM